MQPSNTDATTFNPIGFDSLSSQQPLEPAERKVIDPDSPPWGIWTAILVLILSLIFQIVTSVLLVLPYAASQGAFNSGNEALTRLLTDKTAIFLQVLSLLPAHLLTLAVIWAVVTRFGKRSFVATLGLRNGPLRWWVSVGLGLVLYLAGSGVAKVVGGETPTQLEQIINSSMATRYLIAFLAVASAPVVEELLYRGVLYSALRKTVGAIASTLLALFLFTLIHVPQYWPNYGVLMAVGILSVVLTIIRAYSKCLLPCIIIHLVFNAVQAILLVITAPSK